MFVDTNDLLISLLRQCLFVDTNDVLISLVRQCLCLWIRMMY